MTPWPEEQLDSVTLCPLCHAPERTVLHEGLTDRIFFSAPGRWTLYRCTRCHCAYLDPIPNQASIALAYQNYYTHGAEPSGTSWLGRLKQSLLNDYFNAHYGSSLSPHSPLGRWLIPLLPLLKNKADMQVRHLPCSPQTPKVLADIGCGNGDFLALAARLGWDAWGTDMDPQAVEFARRRGTKVHCSGLPDTGLPAHHFDYVTLSHVIEHVPDPRATLREMCRILKPGGRLWVATPNLDSFGHERFGHHWRGLEPPRHLVLFTQATLSQLFKEQGFTHLTVHLPELPSRWLYQSSHRIEQGKDPYDPQAGSLPLPLFLQSLLADLRVMFQTPERSEFLTISAQSPER
ncbi:class I SAM-dependent methyltransferase [Ferrovum myxofaciens]|jgi:2-polyprenyl-3-methyl-5-hydroxy-6-metoxy-1,4-benzoquinol methylase|uniref:Class I SAM-dependent methyltransferase n=1 Tax=Ferrovum myxofaciens TaxID=416213 RepID=A0A859A8E8_9PROT|nr:class I SAM-dependent methyltransferase [Ferrovum myxofaciens]NDU89374.1 class I SAM-dependent methyltransferase [Ferrovum sp.]KXW58658.1 ubiquinone biosynthesis O-methyltransferase [Ferrovum myxofaciens]MBU6994189.1 class I SAM-dependent methyltransferase [Ferrovum myxofaciens]QKE38125.1 MAG: class I SAM-dependent methyltransferase [Ferrovum myxofaciens]QWY75847.1 MAG: class I SAM-dependent methyltransferase [Ferrovum myxofaciens]